MPQPMSSSSPGWPANRRDARRLVPAYLQGIVDDLDESPIPITVWRAVAAGDTQPAPGDGLSPWLARRLVATYSRRGGTVVDLDADPPIRHAAAASGRGYLTRDRPEAPG